MSSYNRMMETHFKGQPLVHQFSDPYRSRVVSVFEVGDTEVLGVSDGTDAWMVSRTGSINGRPCATLNATTTKRVRHVLREEEQASEGPSQRIEPRPIKRARVQLIV